MRRLKFLVIALATSAAACSPYNFASQLTDFDNSVNALTTSVTSGHDQLVQDNNTSRRFDLIYNQRPVALSPTCTPGSVTSGKDDPPCTVFRVGGSPVASDPEPIDPRLAATVKGLKDYTAALAAITKASDRADFDAAVAKAAASVKGLLGTVPGMGSAAGSVGEAAINVFGWLVGTGFDIQRFETLKKFANYVDQSVDSDGAKSMDVISAYLGTSIATLVADRRNTLYPEAQAIRRTLIPGIGPETYRARLADLESITATMDGLRQVDPITTAKGLAIAHKALVDAINSAKPDLQSLIKALGDLKDKVSALQSAISAASAPAAATTTSKKGS
jgi:hypothetical protein